MTSKTREIIIVSPSLDAKVTLSGISAVARFVVENNKECEYIHFEVGKRDGEKGGFGRVWHLFLSLFLWYRLLGNYPEAIIHYNFPLSPGAIIRDYVFMRLARCRGRKMLIHVHGGLYMNEETIPYLLKRMIQRIFSWGYPIIVLSDNEKRKIVTRYHSNDIIVLPNCVEIDSTYACEEVVGKLVLGYIGRVTKEKGMVELLEACKQLCSTTIEFELHIAGKDDSGGSLIDSFKRDLPNNFYYHGVVSGQEKRDFFRRLNVFVLPSYFEGLPVSLLESMSYGIAPVVTPVGSIPEILNEGENGLFIKVHDVSSIVNTIKKLNENKHLIKEIGNNAQKTIRDNFSPNVYFQKLNNVYRSLG